jgi:hypothetical protein
MGWHAHLIFRPINQVLNGKKKMGGQNKTADHNHSKSRYDLQKAKVVRTSKPIEARPFYKKEIFLITLLV